MKSIKFRIGGLVQGVYFRKYTEAKAQELGLNGWVRNRLDGSVEVLAQGSEQNLKALKEWLWQGSPAAQVGSVESETIDAEALEGFEVLRTE